MSLTPLLAAPPTVQLHTLAAASSVLLLVPITLMQKGTAVHLRIGWAWVLCMLVVCVSSFGIVRSGGYSWIHILSVVSLVSLAIGILQRRRGNINSHKAFMIGAASGLLGAGAFTILPGRIMHAVLLG